MAHVCRTADLQPRGTGIIVVFGAGIQQGVMIAAVTMSQSLGLPLMTVRDARLLINMLKLLFFPMLLTLSRLRWHPPQIGALDLLQRPQISEEKLSPPES